MHSLELQITIQGSDKAVQSVLPLPRAEVFVEQQVASYPGRMGGEKRPGINCLHMRSQFRYSSVKF